MNTASQSLESRSHMNIKTNKMISSLKEMTMAKSAPTSLHKSSKTAALMSREKMGVAIRMMSRTSKIDAHYDSLL